MGWIFATAILLIFVWLLVNFPGFRWGLLVFAIIVVGGGLYLSKESDKRSLLAASLIKEGDLTFSDVHLKSDRYLPNDFTVHGKVKNNSSYTLDGFNIRVRIKDCPTESDCVVIGEDDTTIWDASVPPGQVRIFKGRLDMRNMPKPKSLKLSYSIFDIRAEVSQ